MERLINSFFGHFFQKHFAGLLLLPVLLSGMGLFALPEVFLGASVADRLSAAVSSLIGVLGTVATGFFLRAIRRKPPAWRALGLGPTAWIVLVTAAWLGGAAFGLIRLHDISQ